MDSCFIGTSTNEFQHGLRNAETGYRITGITHTWSDPRTYQNDTEGTPIGFRAGHMKRLEIEITGKVQGTDGGDITALPFTLPCSGTVTVANIISGYGITAGGIYLESLTITEADETDAEFSASLTREPNIS